MLMKLTFNLKMDLKVGDDKQIKIQVMNTPTHVIISQSELTNSRGKMSGASLTINDYKVIITF